MWSVHRPTSAREAADLAASVTACPADHPDRDVEWLQAKAAVDGQSIAVAVDTGADGRVRGVLSAHIYPGSFDIRLGALSVRRWDVLEGPLTGASDDAAALTGALTSLARDMRGADILTVRSVPLGSAMHALLGDRRAPLNDGLLISAFGKPYSRYFIEWRGSRDEYLKSLSKQRRQSLQRHWKKLFSTESPRCVVRKFSTSEDVPLYLQEARAIHAKTYQADLSVGLSAGGSAERMIRFAAARDAFTGYVLYINGQAAAFTHHFAYKRTLQMTGKAYDPAWAHLYVGGSLHLEELTDVEQRKCNVDLLDYGPVFNLFKERTTNLKKPVQDFIVLKRGLFGVFLQTYISADNLLATVAKRMLGKPQTERAD